MYSRVPEKRLLTRWKGRKTVNAVLAEQWTSSYKHWREHETFIQFLSMDVHSWPKLKGLLTNFQSFQPHCRHSANGAGSGGTSVTWCYTGRTLKLWKLESGPLRLDYCYLGDDLWQRPMRCPVGDTVGVCVASPRLAQVHTALHFCELHNPKLSIRAHVGFPASMLCQSSVLTDARYFTPSAWCDLITASLAGC